MDSFEWIAIIGAAAWLPQIAALVYRFAVRPRLHFIPVRDTELTYNSLGPLFNVRAALVVRRKDVVITDMRVLFRHVGGRVIELVWHSFMEKLSEMTTRGGERGEVARDQIATALKVNTSWPTEKFFRFRSPTFNARYRELSAAGDDSLNRLPARDAATLAPFFRSREFTDLISFYQNQFPWQPGRYEVELNVRLLGYKREVIGRAFLELTEADVDRVRGNLPLIEQRLRGISARSPDEELPEPRFWANPELQGGALTLERTPK